MRKLTTFAIVSLISLLLLMHLFHVVQRDLSGCREYSRESLRGNPLGAATTHRRNWNDYTPRSYCMEYTVDRASRTASFDYVQDSIREPHITSDTLFDYIGFYGSVYRSIYEHDRAWLGEMQDSLNRLQQRYAFDRKAFAEMIVTMVQDIPYSYVYADRPCAERPNKKHPCSDGHRFGLIAPMHFLHSLVGDCDTRALLLYSILKEYGYDVIITVSHEYAHAMLAVDLPYSGDFIEHKGKKYYFWETTGAGWPPGALPPSVNYTPYWHVALD